MNHKFLHEGNLQIFKIIVRMSYFRILFLKVFFFFFIKLALYVGFLGPCQFFLVTRDKSKD